MIKINKDIFKSGAISSPYDERDYKIQEFIASKATQFPKNYLVEPYKNLDEISVYNQLNTSMCVAFSCAEIKEQHEFKERGIKQRYSPGFIYGNRDYSDHLGEGMVLRNALRHLVDDGTPPFTDFDYIGDFSTAYSLVQNKKPLLIDKAREQKIKSYVRLYNINEVKTALINLGAVLLSINVTESFFDVKSDGKVPNYAGDFYGRHAMVIVGYTENDEWIVLNSYGKEFGDRGFCYLPFNYKGINELWSLTDLERIIPPISPTTIKMQIGSQKYTVGNVEKEMDVIPKLINGTTLVPVRFIAEALNYKVDWDKQSQSVIINDLLKLQINSKDYYKDNVKYTMKNEPPLLENGRTLVPVRLISELFGKYVQYIPKDKSIIIS